MKQKQENRPLSIEGRVPPHDIPVERAVLGALLLESKAYTRVEDILQPEDFYHTPHKLIYKAICNLSGKRSQIDGLTVTQELRSMGEIESTGGPVYLSELVERLGSTGHLETHAKIVKQKSIARKLIGMSASIQEKAFDESEDVADTMEYAEKELTSLSTDTSGSYCMDMRQAVSMAIDMASLVQDKAQQGIRLSIPTGLQSLDEEFTTSGWTSPDLVIVGARPSMGKTQLALHFAKGAALSGHEVLFISIEMTAVQLVNRYLLEDNVISGHHLHTGQMKSYEWEAVDRKAAELCNMRMKVADGPQIRYLNNIKSEARKCKRNGGLKLMIIDYLGLIRTNMKFERRQLEIGYITGELKALAKELSIPIILLCQLSRPQKGLSLQAKSKNEPQLDDLRESGDIEQDADKVIFIHKPDYYDPDCLDAKGEPWKNKGKLIIAKNRDGMRNCSVVYYHDERYKKIWDKYVDINAKPTAEPSPMQSNESFLDQSGDMPF